MPQTLPATGTEEDQIDLPRLLLICQLMTLYAISPCEPIATSINRYLILSLNSSEANSLGKWQNTLQQLLNQWETISNQHTVELLTAENLEINKVIAH
ncbi:hypothetical protein [Methyloprofundus sp.]|uniref:hypothetical protein n=1 Tax=Methyloprofundus sp. TaxID=2020875 RepID=UPI003D14575B